MKKHFVALIMVLALSFWSIQPLVSPGYFPMHDDTQVGRVIVMGRSLAEGQFPVRWVADLGYGYGYPIFNFYGPLPYYLGGMLYAAGLNSLMATKIMMAIGMLAAGLAMYLLAATVFGLWGGMLAAILYQYAPYHAVELYVRGAAGELWAYGSLPLVGWGLVLTAQKRYATGVLVGAIGLAMVVLSHTIMGYLTLGFLVLGLIGYWLRQILTKKVVKKLLVSHLELLSLGLGLSAFFWWPAIFEMKFTNVAAQVGGGADWRDHFVCLPQLWNSLWGYGGSIPGCIDGFSFKLGKLHLLVALVSVGWWWRSRRQITLTRWASGVALLVVIVSLFLTNSVSAPLWRLPMMDFIQYPWRFLGPAAFGLSLLGATLVTSGSSRLRLPATVILIVATLWLNAKLFVPQYFFSRSVSDFETVEELRWRVSKISDEYLPADLPKPTDSSGIVRATILEQPGLTVKMLKDSVTSGRYTITTNEAREVTIQRAAFPGWQFRLDGQVVEPRVVAGLPRLGLSAGEHLLELSLVDTPVRQISNLVSLLALVIFIWYGKHQYTHA